MWGKDEQGYEEPDPLEVLQFQHIILPLTILGMGGSLSFLVFLREIWLGRRKMLAEQKPALVTDQAGEGSQ